MPTATSALINDNKGGCAANGGHMPIVAVENNLAQVLAAAIRASDCLIM